MSNPNTTRAIVKLDYPVQLADGVLSELHVRRMTVGDMVDHPIQGDRDIQGELRLVAALTGRNAEDIRALDSSDYEKVQEVMLQFRRGKAGIAQGSHQAMPAAD